MAIESLNTSTLQPVAESDAAALAPTSLTANQIGDIRAAYRQLTPRNVALLDEVLFILRGRLEAAQIKIHALEGRIKEEESFVSKCIRKNLTASDEIPDVVGARVICLFRSDMERVQSLIQSNFDVLATDDKLATDNSPLGYVSVHYICKIPQKYTGPRYENIAGVAFEIQVRTLCMHCWAAVSHYLDYKGDWDVPTDLKRALSALSGLFYVADTEFEQFYAARLSSFQKAEQTPQPAQATEINLDTVRAYLEARFPDRRQSGATSSFVQQLKEAGYTSIAQMDRDISRVEKAFTRYEAEHPPTSGGRFLAVGVARLSLRLASEAFDAVARGGSTHDDLDNFRDLVE